MIKVNTTGGRSSAILRIVFGAMWLVDASFKWNLGYIGSFTNYLITAPQTNPSMTQAWIDLWVHGVGVNVYFFAVFVAIAETAIGIGLLFGLLTEVAIAGGVAMVIVLWSTSQSFVGPYVAGSTPIGTTLAYLIVFILLWMGECWRHYSVDSYIRKKFPFLYWHW